MAWKRSENLSLTTASLHQGVMGTWHQTVSVKALLRVLKPLQLTLCSRLNTPWYWELTNTLDRLAKCAILKSLETNIVGVIDYKKINI